MIINKPSGTPKSQARTYLNIVPPDMLMMMGYCFERLRKTNAIPAATATPPTMGEK